MKKYVLLICLLSTGLVMPLVNYAQVVIDRADFPLPTAQVDTFLSAQMAGFPTPSEGPAQEWDYSGLTPEYYYLEEYVDATDTPEFPDAYTMRSRNLIFQAFPIASFHYDGIDEEGWYGVGRHILGVTYPIETITGQASDSLAFPGGYYPFEERLNLVQFPMAYGDTWQDTTVEVTPFLLTVGAYGLNNTPGALRRHVVHEREVVAYGELQLPEWGGGSTPPMDVLMLKVHTQLVDSVFLGGAPAPDALLAAFGMQQAAIHQDTFYVFYKPGFSSYLMSWTIGAEETFFRPRAASTITKQRELQLQQARVFPNPASSGQVITIDMENPLQDGSLHILTLEGRLVYEQGVAAGGQQQLQWVVPSTLTAGAYYFMLYDAHGQLVSNGQIALKK